MRNFSDVAILSGFITLFISCVPEVNVDSGTLDSGTADARVDAGPDAHCESMAECDIAQNCHPTLETCVPDCTRNDAGCSQFPGTTCSQQDIQVVNGLSYLHICVCNPQGSQCNTGFHCESTNLTCEPN